MGFQGSAYTALIGITIGIVIYFTWDQWLTPKIGIYYGCFPLMFNGLSAMAAHYLLPQPAGKGWAGKNGQQKRMNQLIRAFKKHKKSIDLE